MAEQVIVIDDLDGTPGAQSITFGLDGIIYQIDLAEHNHARLREALTPFVAAARPAGPHRLNRALNRTIREWAATHGHALDPLGRIPNAVIRAYRAHPEETPKSAGKPAADPT